MRTAHPYSLLIILALFTNSFPTHPAAEAARQAIAPAGPAAPAEAAPAEDWLIECVDCPYQLTDLTNRSLALDSNDSPQLVAGGELLLYAWLDGAGWQTEILKQGPSASASLALDDSDQPHIAYVDPAQGAAQGATQGAAQGALLYTQRDALGWSEQTVDPAGVNASGASLALDGAGAPHISYSASEGLRYAWWDGASWQIQQVVSGTISHTSLALDEAGYPYISFVSGDPWEMTLQYAHFTGTAWELQTLAGGEYHIIGMNSLALDSTGAPHISYFDYYGTVIHSDSLNYLRWNGAGWDSETVVTGWGAGSANSLALDAQDVPHISYQAFGRLFYTNRLDGGWSIDDIGREISATALALEANGQPHIAYLFNSSPIFLAYTHPLPPPGGWDQQFIDTNSADVGLETSIAVDQAGGRHISYRSLPYGLSYAYSAGAGWTIQGLGGARIAGESALALDGAGQPHIAYLSPLMTNNLYYTHWNGTDWDTEESIAAPVDAFSLALDQDGHPHLSYYQPGFRRLMYLYSDGQSWISQVVDETADVGYFNALALGSDGKPQIAYFDWDHYTLKLARWTGTEWELQEVAEAWNYSLDLALDAADQPHIVYKNQDVLYAHWNGSAWETEFVDYSLDAIQDVSIAIDGAGRPHLAYRYAHGTEGAVELRYARRIGSAWEIQTVDSQAGDDVSLALDASGYAQISYYDAAYGDLKYARLLPPLSLVKTAQPHAGLQAGQPFTYTLTLSGPGLAASLSDPLPASVEFITGSLTAPAVYDPLAHAVLWQGVLPTDTLQTIEFQVTPLIGGAGELPLIVNTAWLTDTGYTRSISATAIVNGWEVYCAW